MPFVLFFILTVSCMLLIFMSTFSSHKDMLEYFKVFGNFSFSFFPCLLFTETQNLPNFQFSYILSYFLCKETKFTYFVLKSCAPYFIFHQKKALKKLWKTLLISKLLFSLSTWLDFCNFFLFCPPCMILKVSWKWSNDNVMK